MTGPLRVAVVGVGHLGRHHARLLAAMPDVTFAAAVDLKSDRAAGAVAGTSAEALTDAGDLRGRADAVVVAVPTADHRAVAEPLLEAGIHVLVEKPMAATLEDAEALVDASRRSGARLAVGHTERFNPAVRAALGEIRAPRFIEVHRLSDFPERSLDIDVVFDVMIHDLDLVLAAAGGPVAGVEAVGVPVLTPRIDIANARVKFATGCIANLTASRISRDRVRKIRFFEPDAYVSVDSAAQELEVWRLRPRPGERPAIEGGPVPVTADEPLRLELLDFLDAIRQGRAPTVSGEDGLAALRLATDVARAIADAGVDGAHVR